MAKTYNTIPTVATGDTYSSTAHNAIVTNVNNYRVPPFCMVRRTSGYTWATDTEVTWESATYDTDSMFSAGAATKVTCSTAGIYVIQIRADIRTTSAFTSYNWNLRVNGTTVDNATMYPQSNPRYAHSWVYPVAAGDYITVSASYAGGGTVTFNGSSGTLQDQSRLVVAWLGQVS